MFALRNVRPILRATLVLGSVGIIATTATFTALQSQQVVLAGNTINSATASLLISTDGTTFNNSKPGFTFSNIVPGGASVPSSGYSTYLKNSGSSNLSLKASISSTPSNLNNVDLTKVFLHITRADNSFDQSFSLKSLMDSYATGGTPIGDTVNAAATTQYLLRVSMSSDAFSNSNGITISGVDIVFTGIAL